VRILVVGAGGVGSAVAAIARRRGFFERMVLADVSAERARAAVARLDGDGRFGAAALDASDVDAIVALAGAERIDTILCAVDPWLNPPVFAAAARAGCTYLDMAMTLSRRHPERPLELPGVMLGDDQFAVAAEWEEAGRLALCGIGVEPGISDVFARYAADHLFERIDEVGVRDGADLAVEGHAFAPTFSIWTTIEECLNPPLIWERERGWYTTAPFSEPETFEFPAGIGAVECVNVEHEEVVLVPRWVECERVTFKYGLGHEFIGVLKTIGLLGLDSTEPLTCSPTTAARTRSRSAIRRIPCAAAGRTVACPPRNRTCPGR
jgi:saccharopine dehydrogenase (NAD+, L-lysine-forming)